MLISEIQACPCDKMFKKRHNYPTHRPPIGYLGAIYDSQLAGINKNTTTNRWKLLLFD
jgi:hypothetical protein